MNSVILITLALVAAAVALPVTEEPVEIIHSGFVQEPEGGYNYNFEASNGINRDETGVVREALDEENKPHSVVVVRGSYGYLGEDGNPMIITYYADETGYHPEGESIPKPAGR